MNKLPSHTTRYWAETAYKAVINLGMSNPRKYKTVQGIDIIALVIADIERALPFKPYVEITWINNKGKKRTKIETIRQTWKY